ncbi:MAG: V-type ATP synthase subunit D [Geobacter sp.]|nr:V-type ATP synthase subunit D [Geobacter sp.]
MIHPTRTNLLLLRDKTRSVVNSVGILKGRRQALIQEFLSSTLHLLRSREEVQRLYGKGMAELCLARGIEGTTTVASLEASIPRPVGVEIVERNVMGLRYRDVVVPKSPVRSLETRGYDYRFTTRHMEEALALFETIVESMLELAAFESRLKRLGVEIQRITIRIRVLEERILPALNRQVRTIQQYIGEREREAYYRLKRFKELGEKGAAARVRR